MPQGDVGHITNRDNAFSLRGYDTSTEEMVYEVTVYWHSKEGGKNKGGGGEEEEEGSPLDFTINGTSGIYYSNKALMSLKDLLPTIDDAIDAVVIKERVTASE